MTSKTAPHTLFELSLLLSALQKYGVDHTSFQKISAEFTENDLISGDSAYDAARFTPDLLQNLYLQVLKDEVRAASQHAAQHAKRKKSPTPPLQSLDEARKHKHHLPGLVKRYYTEFVEQVTDEIKQDEKAFEELKGEIAILEKQPQDDLPEETVASAAHVDTGANLGEGQSGVLSKGSEQPVLSGNSMHNDTRASRAAGRSPQPTTKQELRSLAAKGPSPSVLKSSVDRPSTPSTSQILPNDFESGSFDQSALGSISSHSSAWKDAPATVDAQNSLPTHPLPLPSYATPTHFSTSQREGETPNQHSPHFGTFQSNKPRTRGPLPPSFTPLPAKLFGHLTPSSTINEQRRLQGLPPINTSHSSTRWKDTPLNAKEGRSPPRPGNSPWLAPSPSPEPEFHNTGRHSSPEVNRAADTPTRGRRGGRWPNRARGRGGRYPAGSPGSRGRSQSAMSGAEDSAAESTSRKLKTEPATPGFGDEVTSFVSTPGESRAGPRRRDVLRDVETPKANLKRKRADTTDGTPEVHSAPKFSRPGQILASRNFARIVATMLNNINSHKLASVFAKPLTEKSAPGYLSLIYRPQDLKSIRSAISAGSRFVATIPDPEIPPEDTNSVDTPAAASTPTVSTTKAATIWVERTSEVIPPKGIVNSAQLEKELCRMLANAVMYNPDPKRGFGPSFRMTSGPQHVQDDSEAEMDDADDLDDGRLVNDAREMFASVEQAVAAWRAAERISPGDSAGSKSGAAAGERADDLNDEGAENTGAEDAGEEKSSLRRSTRG